MAICKISISSFHPEIKSQSEVETILRIIKEIIFIRIGVNSSIMGIGHIIEMGEGLEILADEEPGLHAEGVKAIDIHRVADFPQDIRVEWKISPYPSGRKIIFE